MGRRKTFPIMLKMQMNHLARLFYKIQGYVVEEGYDFSKSHHPHETRSWNMALVAYDVINGTDFYKDFRI